SERERRSVQEHLELLSERVWRHTIVLFTWGERLGDTTIEQHIERGGEELQWLVEKCGNRYHVLNNRNRGDGTRVTELLDKIEEMAENRGDMFVSEENLQELKQRSRESLRERGEEQPMKRRNRIDSYDHIPPNRLMYIRRGIKRKRTTPLGLTAPPAPVKRCAVRKKHNHKRNGAVAGRLVTVVDTPGWDLESIKDNAEWVREEIKFSLSLCPPGPHALLLVIPVGSVSERERRAAQEHLELISERVWRHTIVLFTWGERLGDTTIEQHIERGGQELQRLVEEFGEKYYAFKNKSRDGTQVTELLEMIEEMVAENRGQFFTVKMYQEDNEQKLQILEDEIRNLTMEIDQVNQEMFQVDESKYDSQLKGKEKILIVLEGDQRRLREKKESLEKQKNLKVEEVRNIKKYLRRWLPECSEGKAREGGKSHSAPRAEDQRAEPSSTMTPGLTASALGGAVGSVLWPAVVSLIGAAAWSALASGLMEQKEAVRDRH
ncbi:GIMA4 GTPase, partial [Amia calva]|nr:GIMA4 GTPase [Amia calva]